MKYVAVIGSVVVFAVLALFVFWRGESAEPRTPVVQNGPIAEGPREIPKGSREYRNEKYRASFIYPEDLKVNEFDEGGGASTIIFQNAEKGRGFQIFVVPYKEAQVSEEQFKKDIPSGVRNNLEETVIDEVVGATFLSRDMVLGETREVWFIHGGYLFEITVPKALDEWLGTIMGTWKFTQT